jgi:hypothetical protein
MLPSPATSLSQRRQRDADREFVAKAAGIRAEEQILLYRVYILRTLQSNGPNFFAIKFRRFTHSSTAVYLFRLLRLNREQLPS